MKDIDYLKKYYQGDFKVALEQLKNGIPVQYIVGNVDFYGYNFIVNNNVLIPRFETELLVEKTINYIKKIFNNDNIKVLDIGTGSGCIAITLKKEIENLIVDAVDISEGALKVAQENAKKNNVLINFYKSDIFSNVKNRYDIIISNPPYIDYNEEIMDVVYKNEPHLALFAPNNGLYFYDKILSDCSKYLNKKFLIAFEIGMMQAEVIISIAKRYLSNIDVFVEKDLSLKDRYIFIISK